MRGASLLFLALALTACGPPPRSRAAGATTQLQLRAVDWNPSHTPLPHVQFVVEKGDIVAAFGGDGVTVFEAGVPVWNDSTVNNWKGAALLPAPDGQGGWVCGLRGDGRIMHLRGLRALDDVTARFASDPAAVASLTQVAPGAAAFIHRNETAVAQAGHLSHFPIPPFAGTPFEVAAGGSGLVAEVARDEIRLLDAAKRTLTRFPLTGARGAAVGEDGRLFAATSRAVYASDGGGRLALIYDSRNGSVRSLVANGTSAWFVDGQEIAVVTLGLVEETSGAPLASDAKVSAASRGEVWVASSRGLERYARANSAEDPWVTVGPIFSRACATCHLPSGSAGVDLSTAALWARRRVSIREQVLEKQTMPPAGHVLLAADRETLAAWLEHDILRGD